MMLFTLRWPSLSSNRFSGFMSLIRQNINNYSLNRKEILHRKDISCICMFAILGFVAGLKREGFENYLRDLKAPVDDGERVEVVEGGDDLGGVEKGGRVRELAGAEECDNDESLCRLENYLCKHLKEHRGYVIIPL